MVFDKSDQHQTVYDCCDVELAVKYVQFIALENSSTTYSLTGQLEYNVSNEEGKHCTQMFVTYYCEGCSAAPQHNIKITRAEKRKRLFWR